MPLGPLPGCLAARFWSTTVEFFEIAESHTLLFVDLLVILIDNIIVEVRVSFVPLDPALPDIFQLLGFIPSTVLSELFVTQII